MSILGFKLKLTGKKYVVYNIYTHILRSSYYILDFKNKLETEPIQSIIRFLKNNQSNSINIFLQYILDWIDQFSNKIKKYVHP